MSSKYSIPIRQCKCNKQRKIKKINTPIVTDLYEISQLKEIFYIYSNNEKYLTNKQYFQFLSDSQLINDDNLSIKNLNILFYSFSKAKNNLTFLSFCDLIIKLAEIKFQDEFINNQTATFSKFISIYIIPLIEILKSNINSLTINYRLLISKLSTLLNKEIFEGNYLLFVKIYLKYFCFEKLIISNKQKEHLSSRAFIRIMNDFEICPSYITIEQLNEVYGNIILNKDFVLETMNRSINNEMCSNEGNFFTLYHFMASFYLLAVNNILITNNEEEQNNLWLIFANGSDSEALDTIIQLIYKSQNIKNVMPNEINQAESKDNNSKNSNENNQDENISNNENNNNEMNNSNNDLSENSQNNIKSSNNNLSRKNIEKYNTNSNRNIDVSLEKSQLKSIPKEENNKVLKVKEMYPEIIKKYHETLIPIYKFYSELFYETIFSIYMTQNGFTKFIRDMGLESSNYNHIENSKMNESKKFKEMYLNDKLKANLLSFSTINFYFSKFSTNSKGIIQKNNNKRIDFENFVYLILCLSNKIYNPQFNSISFENKSFPIESLLMSEFPMKYTNDFIDNYVIPLYNDIRSFIEEESFSFENLNLLLDSIKNNIDKITTLLIKILKVYSNGEDFINYSQYFKMLSDFEIFPNLISRTKMIKIFIHFIDNFDNEYLIKGNNKILLSNERCAKAILFIGIESENKQIQEIENNEILTKLIYFLEKIGQTKGLKNVSLKTGNSSIQNDYLKIIQQVKNKVIPQNDKEENRFS